MDDRDRAYFGRSGDSQDQIGFLDENTRSIFGRSYAAEPDQLIEELARDEAIAEADTLLLTVPNQLGVGYNTHVLESILTHVPPRWAGARLLKRKPGRRRRYSAAELLWSPLPRSIASTSAAVLPHIGGFSR